MTPLYTQHRERGLKVDDETTDMMKEVERELTVTKACSHPNVVQVLGLMVGPGRIGLSIVCVSRIHCMCVTNSISNLKHTAITLHTYSQHCKLCFTMAT